MEYLIGIVGAVIAFLLYQVRSLWANKQLNDSKIEDAKLQTTQDQLASEIKAAKEKLAAIHPEKAQNMTDEEIVKFWKDNLQ